MYGLAVHLSMSLSGHPSIIDKMSQAVPVNVLYIFLLQNLYYIYKVV